MGDALRLAVGTLTRVPVPPPRRLDAGVAGGAMLLAPLVGLVLATVIGGAVQVLDSLVTTPVRSLLLAALAVSALAYATRALHLDGLADTADALGSGRPPADALAIARRSDIGPFGVVTLVLVLLVQVVAYAGLVADGMALGGLVLALVTGRLALVLACTAGVPAARPDGLGATVAGSVPAWASALTVVTWLLLGVGGALLVAPDHVIGAAAAMLVALACGAVVVRVAVRRLGGITGDVLGATVEITTTAALVILVAIAA